MGKKVVGSAEFRKNIASFLDMVMRGDEIEITRSKRPIAILRPVDQLESEEEKGKGEG